MVRTKDTFYGTTQRKSFGKIDEVMDTPNLIKIQKDSYADFTEKGLKNIIRDSSEISDHSGKFIFRFTNITLDKRSKYSIKECKERQISYSAPLKVSAELINTETGVIKTGEVFMGEFPLMTDSGTFIINGAERAIISQLVRSPGVYYAMDHDMYGKKLFTATVMPNRGAWLEYETDAADIMYVKIEKSKRIPLTTFLRAIGVFTEESNEMGEGKYDGLQISSDDDVRSFFDYDETIDRTIEKDKTKNSMEALLEIYGVIRPGEPRTVDSAKTLFSNLFFDTHRYDISRVGRYKYNKKLGIANRLAGFKLAQPLFNETTGEIIADEGEVISKERAEEIEQAGVKTAYVLVEGQENPVKIISNNTVDIKPYLPQFTEEELEEAGINERVSYVELMKILPEINDSTKEDGLAILKACADDLIPKHIEIDDMLATINYFYCLAHEVGNVDDIDHLGNRRIRCVGELLENQVRVGFSRMERVIRERLGLQAQEPDKVSVQSIINARPVMAAVREFFGSSPLSQFMDQNNPLSELTHKRRLSALGPGGLSRDRAGFEVRDVHYTHYGRMCPIETPEGPNIGLISYIATFARINKYGFIETPYRKIEHQFDKKGEIISSKVLDEYEYMTADVEDQFIVVQGNEPLDENNCFIRKRVNARFRDEFLEIDPSKADYMDITPRMVVSVATSLIPFLENDDANRALMGANMQRQAVPLLTCDPPYVGTGMEYRTSTDSGACVLAEEAGTVVYVSADRVEVKEDADDSVRTYELIKYMRSNQDTCINQTPVVNTGDKVVKGQVIADGPATKNGELSLGKNALIGFMTWEGYNYEDAVLINEKLVQNDVYTSIHIERYEVEARETKLGPEEITRDIPNVGEDARKDLDERGIIRIGAEVKSGDILVGKTSPKGETEITPEERLLRAIFGEKSKEVRDTSLRVPHGSYGIVVNVEEYTRETSSELQPGVNKVVRCYIAQKRKIQVGDKMAGRHGNKGVVSRVLPQQDMPFLSDGTPLDIVLNPLGVPSRMNIGQVLEVHLGFACRALGWHIATPVFDGAHEEDIRAALEEAGLPINGKSTLTDGRTGEKFDQDVTVGVMYYLKLHHLVDDKMHARSTGPYSLVTQQPLGGKAQFGGQRFGEMEVWALEAYGAAYTLQEIITYKSDDIVGRDKAYQSIVEGKNIPSAGIPESFRVLVKELQSLALDIKIYDEDEKEIELKLDLEDGFGRKIVEAPVQQNVVRASDDEDMLDLDDDEDQLALDDDDDIIDLDDDDVISIDDSYDDFGSDGGSDFDGFGIVDEFDLNESFTDEDM